MAKKAKAAKKAKKAKKKLDPLVIESQITIGEVQTKSMELVKISRVRYEGNDFNFIDIRVFQRGWTEGVEVYYPTRRGIQLKESDFEKLMAAFNVADGPPTPQVH